MTGNSRIALNIVATYGRSLYALAVGLFCGRWTLMALGEVDYGLLSVVGGLTVFIAFLNSLLGSAVGRFYGVAIGQCRNNPSAGLEECRRWFSVAVAIHTIVPLALMSVGYPAGEWAVRCFLRIPPDRIETCVWVFRFVCISCFAGMVSVPFTSMYTMKQYIAELTVYSFITATLNVLALWYMVSHPGVWLAKYALWTCALTVAPMIVIAARACFLFPECRFRVDYARDVCRIRRIAGYAGWTAFGGIASVLRTQGNAILVNKFFGPAVNAAMGVASSVNSHALSLTNALQGAMSPVITAAFGAGDMELVRRLSFRFCKVSMALALLFMLPLALELPEVMRLWLGNPPEYATGLCWIMLAISFLDKQTLGHGMAVMACGRLKGYQTVLGFFNLLSLPLAWIFCMQGLNAYWVGLALFATYAMFAYSRLFFARSILGMGLRHWASRIMLPVLSVLAAACASGALPMLFLPRSAARLAVTAFACEIVFIPLVWLVILDREERLFVMSRVKRILHRG